VTPLDADLDLDTLELTEIAFAEHTILIPPGLNHYEAAVPISPEGHDLLVQIDAALDFDTRELTVEMLAVDPATGWLPQNVMLGLLYPNDDTGRGEGHVSYIVKPKSGLPSGTEITNRATIVFDWNDPIDTPLVLNTIDAEAPESSVLPLPATTTETTFEVQWSGQEEASGSGIAHYDVYVSDNDGPFVLWLNDTTETSANFTGEDTHTYAFYSTATDNVGHTEGPPTVPDAVTRVLLNRPPVAYDDTVTTDEDVVVVIAVLGNDDDPDMDPLTVASVDTTGTLRAVTVNPDQTVSYTPPANFHGTDSFTYKAQDDAESNVATVTITINAVADTPSLSASV
jgi:hypothetical protein